MNGWKNELVYRLLVKILTNVSVISEAGLRRWSEIIGDLWFACDTKHRQVAMSNLVLVKSELEKFRGTNLTRSDLYGIARRNFKHITRVFLEIPRFNRITADNVTGFITCSGAEEVIKARKEGKGIILLTGHFGNWELTAHVAPFYLGTPINIVARPLDFYPFERLITEVRCRTGNKVFARRSSSRKILRSLKQREIIGILQDQRSAKHEGVIVPLLGRPAISHKGMAILAARTDAAVIPVFSHRRPDGRYHIEIFPRLYLINTGNVKKDIFLNTTLFNRVLEKQIKRFPEQWFWVHRRWKIERKKKKRLWPKRKKK